MIEDQQFRLISKALSSTQKSLEEQEGHTSPAVLQISQAREEMIKALTHATEIEHQSIIETLLEQ
ncbi:hypothetical protein [Metabacillus malikii]|uniref:Uncharacterized protein n=1 Tax=Metabacillus malikii TaxID=1504265 RepID=A0ABT9Z984_9BACI|nr:hypothetical protein [Metabacillus malikii]MDQ0228811.1 hypothetical protein [Metabacillus malikii]